MVFDEHAGGCGDSARNLITWIFQQLKTTSLRSPSDINLELARRISSSLHRDSARAILRRVRLGAARDASLLFGSDDWWPAWDDPNPRHEGRRTSHGDDDDVTSHVTRWDPPIVPSISSPFHSCTASPRFLLGSPVQVAVPAASRFPHTWCLFLARIPTVCCSSRPCLPRRFNVLCVRPTRQSRTCQQAEHLERAPQLGLPQRNRGDHPHAASGVGAELPPFRGHACPPLVGVANLTIKSGFFTEGFGTRLTGAFGADNVGFCATLSVGLMKSHSVQVN